MKTKAPIFVFAILGICASIAPSRGATGSDTFPDICSLDTSHVRIGTTVKARAAVIPAAGWYVSGLVGRNCTNRISFTIDGPQPRALVDEINQAINQGKGLSVEANMTLYVSGYRPGPANSKIGATWSVVVRDAKNFRLVPITFNEANK